MERELHYVWRNRIFPATGLITTEGKKISVLSSGLHNKDAGPDFFCADIIIGAENLMGNVEIHVRSTDWYRHGHDKDPAYNNVVLHVVEQDDGEAITQDGRKIPQLVLPVPEYVKINYARLQDISKTPPCYSYASEVPAIIRNGWFERLCNDRLKRKANDIKERLEYCNRDWEYAFFITIARAFGFGINSDAFEQWARIIPYGGIAKHRDNFVQILAMFLGQAGFLGNNSQYSELISASIEDLNAKDLHILECAHKPPLEIVEREYKFLADKFSLTLMSSHVWRFMRTRPSNFPIVRIIQLARLYNAGHVRLSAVIEADTLNEVHDIFSSVRLSKSTINLLIINAVVPMLYSYGLYKGIPKLCLKSQRFLREIPAENNKYTRLWAQTSLPIANAAESQAIVQLISRYCERHDCLRCQLGHQYIKHMK